MKEIQNESEERNLEIAQLKANNESSKRLFKGLECMCTKSPGFDPYGWFSDRREWLCWVCPFLKQRHTENKERKDEESLHNL